MSWIKVTDDLPDYEEKVIVFGKQIPMSPQMGGNPEVIIMTSRVKTAGTGIEKQRRRYVDDNEFRMMEYVTHWMRLPQKPNEQVWIPS